MLKVRITTHGFLVHFQNLMPLRLGVGLPVYSICNLMLFELGTPTKVGVPNSNITLQIEILGNATLYFLKDHDPVGKHPMIVEP